jgi:hypothetical protein
MMFSGIYFFPGLFWDVFEILWLAAQQQQVVVGFTEASSQEIISRGQMPWKLIKML